MNGPPEHTMASYELAIDERALDAIIRRLKKLDREHDIPYLAGYNMDGTSIYIDRHRFRILHEEVEKTMIGQLNLHYLHARTQIVPGRVNNEPREPV